MRQRQRQICRELVAHGLAAETPAAVVERATTISQRVTAGTLLTLPVLVRAAGAQAPALVVVGEVVRLRESLSRCNRAAASAGGFG